MTLYTDTLIKKENELCHDEAKITALILCDSLCSHDSGCDKTDKLMHFFGKKISLENTIEMFQKSYCTHVKLLINRDNLDSIAATIKNYDNISFIFNESNTSLSVHKALKSIGDNDTVVICPENQKGLSVEHINKVIDLALEKDTAITIYPPESGARKSDFNETPDYKNCYPQGFNFKKLLAAFDKLVSRIDINDEVNFFLYNTPAAVYNYNSLPFERRLNLIYNNNLIKEKTLSALYGLNAADLRIGVGFDVHDLIDGDGVILGGVTIAHHKKLKGHSDADVVVHAIMDALLSAVGEQDIGSIFPDNDPQYKGISSILLLKKVYDLIFKNGFRITNISAVIMAERPLLRAHIPQMRQNIAATLGIKQEQVNISATTTEHLGIIGEEKGIASSAMCIMHT